MKKQTKLIGILAVAVTLVLVIGCVLFSKMMPEKEKWIYVEEQVKRGTLIATATESGSLEYRIKPLLYDLGIQTEKYLQVEEIYVATGQRVQAGDALVKFSSDSVSSLKKLLENSVVEAKASYLEAEREYELAEMELKTAYDNAQIESDYADDIYEDSDQAVNNAITAMDKEITLREELVSFFKDEVKNAQEEYDEANKKYQEAKKKMSATGTKNVPNYLVINEEYQKAQNEYFEAQNTLKQVKTDQEANNRRITELEAKLADAKARIVIDKLEAESVFNESTLLGDNAQAVYDSAVSDLQKVLAKEEQLLEECEQSLEDFEAFVGEDGILYAAKDCVIIEIGCEKGDRLAEKSTLLNYAEDMIVTVEVAQEDVVALKTEDAVEICFALYPEQTYNGYIQTIDITAVTVSASDVCYRVVAAVVGDTTALYSGMAAEVTFVTHKKENVLYVPEDAIVEEDGRSYVYVQTVSGGYGMKEVETGLYSEIGVEILAGLNEGDRIYVLRKATDTVSSGDVNVKKVSDGDASDRRDDLE